MLRRFACAGVLTLAAVLVSQSAQAGSYFGNWGSYSWDTSNKRWGDHDYSYRQDQINDWCDWGDFFKDCWFEEQNDWEACDQQSWYDDLCNWGDQEDCDWFDENCDWDWFDGCNPKPGCEPKPECSAVPTPTAAAAGMIGMGLLAFRRRRTA